MTRIIVFSDLHIEFDRQGRELPMEDGGHPVIGPRLEALRGQADVIVMAGDIDLGIYGVGYADSVSRYLEMPVILIAGNHEFYRQVNLEHVIDNCRKAAMGTDGRVIFLERETAVIRDIRFLGCTLWTDFQLFGKDRRFYAMQTAGHGMNDFKLIRNRQKYRFTPDNAVAEFEQSIKYLRSEFEKPFDGPTVVITHMAPSRLSVPGRFKNDLMSAAFVSNLDEVVSTSGAVLWVHGHIHDSFDYTIGDTRVLCNPRGYFPNDLNLDFDPELIVKI